MHTAEEQSMCLFFELVGTICARGERALKRRRLGERAGSAEQIYHCLRRQGQARAHSLTVMELGMRRPFGVENMRLIPVRGIRQLR
jgi:hypothetical protein